MTAASISTAPAVDTTSPPVVFVQAFANVQAIVRH